MGLTLVGTMIVSCLDDENTETFSYKYSAIDSISVDTIMPVFRVTEIKTYFKTTNSCQQFYNYDYTALGKERTVAAVIAEDQNQSCEEIISNQESVLKFRPEARGIYTFRFWNGRDADGQDQFIIKEIQVN